MSHRAYLAASIVAITMSGAADAEGPQGGVFQVPTGETPSAALARATNAGGLLPATGTSMAPASASGTAFPVMRNGAILQSLLTVGDPRTTPILKFDYTTGVAGFFAATFDFTSPSGTQGISLVITPSGYTTHGTLVFTNPVTAPYFAQPGRWTMTLATIQDWDGQVTSYTPKQAQSIFNGGSLTVVNTGPVSTAAPTVLSGQVVTPTVSLSNVHPAFHVRMTVADKTGVTEPYIVITPPGASFGQTDQYFLPMPVKSGVIDAYAGLYPYQPAGTWAISAYEVCNEARNCFTDTSPGDISTLFGTTSFTVTK